MSEWTELRKRLDDAERHLSAIRVLVDRQAQDEGLWFRAATAPEAYLQQELRKLHDAVEKNRTVEPRRLGVKYAGSTTPITDSEELWAESGTGDEFPCVPSSVARQLEEQLTTALKALERSQTAEADAVKIPDLASMCRRLSYRLNHLEPDSKLVKQCVDLLKRFQLGGNILRAESPEGKNAEERRQCLSHQEQL